MTTPHSAAELPPSGLPGLDPAWSRLVTARDAAGDKRSWHVLTAGAAAADARVTLVCVHGNPTWSYLWRGLAAAVEGSDVRVIALDQLEMGWSERTSKRRTLSDRIVELDAVVEALGVAGDVVPVGHDWGGIVATGWAARVAEHEARPGAARRLAGLVLTNTGVTLPNTAALGPVRFARLPGVLPLATSTSDAFLRVVLGLANPALSPETKAAFAAPYGSRARRAGIQQFVADIPTSPAHPTHATLAAVAEGASALQVPVLMLWGARDPVFGETFLRDLRARIPHADVHRFETAGHLLPEDVDVAAPILRWLAERVEAPADKPRPEPTPAPDLWAHLSNPQPGEAVIELTASGASRSVSWALLAKRVDELAMGLRALGIRQGQRVSLLVPPGADLTAAVYAVLRIGAVAVVADAGLGVRGLTRAVTGSGVDAVIGVPKALAAARALGWPGIRIAAGRVPTAALAALGTSATLASLARDGRAAIAAGAALPPPPSGDADAAILFTSGSTGPAKGVVYTHRQLAQLAHAMGRVIGIGEGAGLVSAFAPFALLGPALGASCVVPAMDVTRPATLTARALAQAVAASGATTAFLAPAALVNVLATAGDLDEAERQALASVRRLVSAGAPVPTRLLQQARELMPLADPRTPYGATEVLPATDVGLSDIIEAGAGEGICVGRPIDGAVIAIAPLGDQGEAGRQLTLEPGVTGELVVGAEHVKDRYDQRWATHAESVALDPPPGEQPRRWHRTGDVGHLDAEGRVWVEGRLAHVIVTPRGVVTPVGAEQRAEQVDGIARAALVGVGPAHARQLALVAEAEPGVRRTTVADPALADAVREATGQPLVAILLVEALPTDVRHNSKIDRVAVSAWAEGVLAGRRMPPLARRRA